MSKLRKASTCRPAGNGVVPMRYAVKIVGLA
uniref:Uncharacterized protein n=1 Tax=Anguilla anguilla TaxID=7936 RepID=A0A0E9XSC3_ANGAN